MQDGLPHGLAGNGAGIDASAAYDFALLNHGHAAAALRALDGGTLARRARANNDEIVITHSKG